MENWTVLVNSRGVSYYYLNGKRLPQSDVPDAILAQTRVLNKGERINLTLIANSHKPTRDNSVESSNYINNSRSEHRDINSISTLETLPIEMLAEILSHTTYKDLLSVSKSSKTLISQCSDLDLWKIIIHNRNQKQYTDLVIYLAQINNSKLFSLLWDNKFVGKIKERIAIRKSLEHFWTNGNLKEASQIEALNKEFLDDTIYGLSIKEYYIRTGELKRLIKSKKLKEVMKFIKKNYDLKISDIDLTKSEFNLTLDDICDYYRMENGNGFSCKSALMDNDFLRSVLYNGNLKLLIELDDRYGGMIYWSDLILAAIASTNPDIIHFVLNKNGLEGFDDITQSMLEELREPDAIAEGEGYGVTLAYKPLRDSYLTRYPTQILGVVHESLFFMTSEEIIYYLNIVKSVPKKDIKMYTNSTLLFEVKQLVDMADIEEFDYIKLLLEDWITNYKSSLDSKDD